MTPKAEAICPTSNPGEEYADGDQYELDRGQNSLKDNRANVLSFSPDGTKLLTGFRKGSAMIWDVRREK